MPRQKQASEPDSNLLNKPGIVVPRPGKFSSFCFYAVLFLLAWAGAFGCFLTAFGISVQQEQFVLWSVIFTLISAMQYLPERRRWIMPLCTLSIWGFALWRNWEDAVQGALRIGNTMVTAYSVRLNVRKVLPQFAVQELPPETEEAVVTLFLIFLAFLFFWLLSLLFVRHQSLLGTFGLTGLFLLSHLGFSIVPNRWAFGLLLVFWAFLLLAAPSLRQRSQTVEHGSSFHAAGAMFRHPVSLLLLPVLALFLLLIYTAFPPESYERPEFFIDMRSQLNNSLNLQTVFRGGTGHSDRVDFSALGTRFYTGKTALQVRHEWQNGAPSYKESPISQKDFLKGFVGSVYTGTSWERLSREDAKTAAGIWGDRNVQTLPADLMQSLPMDSDLHSSYFVTVRKLGGDYQSIYSPYGLYSPLGAPNNMEYQDDGFLAVPRGTLGTDRYALSAVAIPMLDNVPTYKDRLSAYLSDLTDTDHFRSQYGTASAETISKQVKKSIWRSTDGDQWRMASWMKELLPEKTLAEVIEPLEQYHDFVDSHYTQVPDGLRNVLTKYAEEHGLSLKLAQEDRISYLREVKRILAENCTYSWAPPSMSGGKDFVTYFLTESRTGYCVHFATAATMLLRTAGIPARYAEGFAVPTDTLADENGWVDVPDYNAHSWVEVYWGGMGWIPVDMTPAGDSVPAAYSNAVSPGENEDPADLQGVSAARPTPSAPPDLPGDNILTPSLPPLPVGPASSPDADRRNSPSPSPSPGAASRNDHDSSPANLSLFGMELLASGQLTFFGITVLLILLLLVAALLIWAQRLIRLSMRRLSFRQRNRNKAALYVYAHLLRLYRESRLLPGGSGEPPEEVKELALKARFSQHTLTEEEFSFLTERAAELEKKLKSGLPRGEWFKSKYLWVLF